MISATHIIRAATIDRQGFEMRCSGSDVFDDDARYAEVLGEGHGVADYGQVQRDELADHFEMPAGTIAVDIAALCSDLVEQGFLTTPD